MIPIQTDVPRDVSEAEEIAYRRALIDQGFYVQATHFSGHSHLVVVHPDSPRLRSRCFQRWCPCYKPTSEWQVLVGDKVVPVSSPEEAAGALLLLLTKEG